MLQTEPTHRELGENRVVPGSDCIIIMRRMIIALAARDSVRCRARGRARNSGRRPGAGVRQAGGPAAATAHARAAHRDARSGFSARASASGSRARRRRIEQGGEAVDRRQRRAVRRRNAPRLSTRRRGRVSLPSDKSFASYKRLGALTGPRLPDNTELYWNQGLLDVLFEYPIESDSSEFSIHPRLERLGLRTVTALRFLPPGRRDARFRVPRRSRPGPARSALAPGGVALRQSRDSSTFSTAPITCCSCFAW